MREERAMPPASDEDAVVRAWEEDVRAALVTPAEPDRVHQIAATAAAAVPAAAAATGAAVSGAAAAATAAAGMSVGAKIAVVAALVTALGGAAAAAGVLPDPIQRWIADLVDDVGIEIPRPPSIIPGEGDVPIEIELPDIGDLPIEEPLDLLP